MTAHAVVDTPQASDSSGVAGLVRKLARSIPLARGPQWYLVAYRWLLVAAGVYTVAVTWNVWQVRSGPAMADVPMLPVWEWLPQVDFGYAILASLVAVLIVPRAGLIVLSCLLVLSVLFDQTRLQPHYQMALLMWGTLPGKNAQFFGRMSLVSLWFWVGFHKLLIDFIKPEGMSGFASDIIPSDLARFFPPEQFTWNTPLVGHVVGWSIAIAEISLGLMCLIPSARWLVGIGAFIVHFGIILWNCWSPWCNLLGWNVSLMLAGFVLIVPWREGAWTSWRGCHSSMRAVTALLLVYPATYYLNWAPAYLSYCVYVPNSPYALLYRMGEEPKFVPFMTCPIISFPLPPGQSMNKQYFSKIRRPGDVMIIYDPRPWARWQGVARRQLTDLGDLPGGEHWVYSYPDETKNAEGDYLDGMKHGLWTSWHPNGNIAAQGVMLEDLEQGHWTRWHSNGKRKSEGDYRDGQEQGHWTFWYDDGQEEMEGSFVDGQMDGLWTTWSPTGEKSQIEFRAGVPAVPVPSQH